MGYQRDGRSEAFEVRRENDRRARRERAEASAVRSRREKGASVGPRADVAGRLREQGRGR